jgi:hypothetical protein
MSAQGSTRCPGVSAVGPRRPSASPKLPSTHDPPVRTAGSARRRSRRRPPVRSVGDVPPLGSEASGEPLGRGGGIGGSREPQPRRSDRRFDAGQGQIQRRNRSLIVSSCLSTRSLTAACCSGETSSVRRSTGRSGVPCADVIALQDYSPIDDAGVGHGHVPRSHPSCTVGGTRRGDASSAPDDRADQDRTCHADTAMAGSGPSAARGGVRWMPRRA